MMPFALQELKMINFNKIKCSNSWSSG